MQIRLHVKYGKEKLQRFCKFLQTKFAKNYKKLRANRASHDLHDRGVFLEREEGKEREEGRKREKEEIMY